MKPCPSAPNPNCRTEGLFHFHYQKSTLVPIVVKTYELWSKMHTTVITETAKVSCTNCHKADLDESRKVLFSCMWPAQAWVAG